MGLFLALAASTFPEEVDMSSPRTHAGIVFVFCKHAVLIVDDVLMHI